MGGDLCLRGCSGSSDSVASRRRVLPRVAARPLSLQFALTAYLGSREICAILPPFRWCDESELNIRCAAWLLRWWAPGARQSPPRRFVCVCWFRSLHRAFASAEAFESGVAL